MNYLSPINTLMPKNHCKHKTSENFLLHVKFDLHLFYFLAQVD